MSAAPMLPTRAGPLLMPTRNYGCPAGSGRDRTARCIASPARAAPRAWYGWGLGALKGAIMVPPMACTIVAPPSSTLGSEAPNAALSLAPDPGGERRPAEL